MSNYQAPAYHPRTGELQDAMFLDDYFGKHLYGVQFADGKIYPADYVKVPRHDEPEQPKE